jgi:hypothetical protein
MAAPKKTAPRTAFSLNDILTLRPPFTLADVKPAPRTLFLAVRDGGVMMLGRPDPDAGATDDPDAPHLA